MITSILLRRIIGGLVPPLCGLCGGRGQDHGFSIWGLDLCAACEIACPDPADPCPAPGSLDAIRATHAYGPPVDTLVRELKFRGMLPHARILGMLMAARRRNDRPLPDALVPIPLGRYRFVERGFNQAEEIARHAARHLGLPLRTGLLRRTRETDAQSGLGAAARHANLHGAFAVERSCIPRRIALVDDVLTTGATASAAARALKEAGATWVETWVAARALRTADLEG